MPQVSVYRVHLLHFGGFYKLYLGNYMFKQIHRINASNPVALISNRQTHTYSTCQANNFYIENMQELRRSKIVLFLEVHSYQAGYRDLWASC